MDYQNQIVREDMCELAKEHLPFEKLKEVRSLLQEHLGCSPPIWYIFLMYLNETRKYDINVTALVRNEKKHGKNFEDFRRYAIFPSEGAGCVYADYHGREAGVPLSMRQEMPARILVLHRSGRNH